MDMDLDQAGPDQGLEYSTVPGPDNVDIIHFLFFR